MSVLALVGLNIAYTALTGTYFFLDSNIPIAVFLGAPTFYDKLLCVPLLNLMVSWIDIAARKFRSGSRDTRRTCSEISAAANRIHMLAWIAVFSVMLGTNFVGRGHPGKAIELWKTHVRKTTS